MKATGMTGGRPMTVYVSIPITGRDPARQLRHARRVAAWLASLGHAPVIPMDNGLPPSAPWEAHMRRDLAMMVGCDAVFMCSGWQDSDGCVTEHFVARRVALPLFYEDELYLPCGRHATSGKDSSNKSNSTDNNKNNKQQ